MASKRKHESAARTGLLCVVEPRPEQITATRPLPWLALPIYADDSNSHYIMACTRSLTVTPSNV